MSIDGYACSVCGSTEDLQVHHITYEKCYGEEDEKDLITLCKSCHQKLHDHKNKFDQTMDKKAVEMVRKIISSDDFKNAVSEYNIEQQRLIGEAIVDVVSFVQAPMRTSALNHMVLRTLSPKKATDILSDSVYEMLNPFGYARIKRGKKKFGAINTMEELEASVKECPTLFAGGVMRSKPGFFISKKQKIQSEE